ncbi:MAG: PGF-CTERM sorting domain-containing protein, partial [Methanosarcina mazei]|nr:PGF-CTERM sorting domain-containing protein [Methanosarcina mazei]
SPVVNVGKIITLEGSSPQPEGSTSSNEEKDETSDPSTDGTEEDYEDTPGFGFFLAVAGILKGTGFIMKKKA